MVSNKGLNPLCRPDRAIHYDYYHQMSAGTFYITAVDRLSNDGAGGAVRFQLLQIQGIKS